MAKMPMTRNPKTGKMVPSFAMDGKGKMAKGGAVKPMAKGGAVKPMAKGGAVKPMAKGGAVKPMAKGGSVKMRGGGMAKGYKIGGKIETKGSTSGGVKRVAKNKRDGIAKRGKTRA
jgi:hypothetical protein